MPPDPQTLTDAGRRWAQSLAGQTVTADEDALALLAQLRDLKARQKALDYERDLAELALKARLGTAEALIGPDGKPLCTWKTSTRRSVDTAALKSAGLYETYTKVTESRTFKVQPIAGGKRISV